MLLVKKPDGTWRTDSYPMPRIDDMLDRLHGAKYFSKLDMTDGLGFATTSKFWQWRVLPMGAMNSPSAFQRAMDQVLGDLKWKSVMCYVDDLIIFSKTIEEHMQHIEEVLRKLADAGIYSKLLRRMRKRSVVSWAWQGTTGNILRTSRPERNGRRSVRKNSRISRTH